MNNIACRWRLIQSMCVASTEIEVKREKLVFRLLNTHTPKAHAKKKANEILFFFSFVSSEWKRPNSKLWKLAAIFAVYANKNLITGEIRSVYYVHFGKGKTLLISIEQYLVNFHNRISRTSWINIIFAKQG